MNSENRPDDAADAAGGAEGGMAGGSAGGAGQSDAQQANIRGGDTLEDAADEAWRDMEKRDGPRHSGRGDIG